MEIHIKALMELIKRQGGLVTLPSYLSELVCLADLLLATATNSTPYVPMELVQVAITIKKGAKTSRAFEMSKEPVPESFTALLSSSLVDEELGGILSDLYQLFAVLNKYENVAVSQEFWTPLPAQLLVIGHSLCFYSSAALSQPWGDFRECCRMAGMIVVHSVLLKNHPHTTMIRNLVRRLQTYLECLNLQKLWLSNPEILLWILFVGAAGSQGQVERPWFITLLVSGSNKLRLHSWDDARAMLKRFLYVDKMLDPVWRKIWASVEQVSSL